MVLGLAIGYLLGVVSMYTYMYATAQECDSAYCFDCRELSCRACPYLEELKLAA